MVSKAQRPSPTGGLFQGLERAVAGVARTAGRLDSPVRAKHSQSIAADSLHQFLQHLYALAQPSELLG